MAKRIFALMMALCMLLCAVSCAGSDKPDSQYVKDKGVLVVGITDFAPMDYQDADGNWIGFDADLAKAFAESLGVKVEFSLIEWGQKVNEINGKSIDCVWNGMTLTDEVTTAMSCSVPYCKNAQVVVIKADRAADYTTEESLKDLRFAVEASSAGEEIALERGFTVTSVDTQAKALMEVQSGTSDAAIVDLLMAGAMIGEGTSYESLTYTVGLNEEEYGVGFRKNSDLVETFNAFLKSAYADGTVAKLAETYGITDNIIEQK